MINKDKLIQLYINGTPNKEIAKIFSKSLSTIEKFITLHQITNHHSKPNKSNRINKDEFIELYISGSTSKDIAATFGVSTNIVKTFIRNNQISKKYTKATDINSRIQKEEQNIIKKYNEGQKIKVIAEELNCGRDAIVKIIKDNKLPRRNNFKELPLNIIDDYLSGTNATQLAEKHNCSFPKILHFLREHDVQIRDRTKLLRERNADEAIQKKRQSIRGSKKPYTLPSGKTIPLMGYEPDFLDYVFSHKILEEHQIENAPERIAYTLNNKQHYYYPDFKIPHLDTIVEVKSTYIKNIQGGEEVIKAKQEAVEKLGMKFILVLDRKHAPLQSTLIRCELP